MIEFARRSLLSLLLASATMTVAQADGLPSLQTKVDAAFKAAKSFVVMTSYPAQAYSSMLVVVAPDRTRLAVALSANTTDVVTIGQMTYSSKNGAPFERSAMPADAAPRSPVAIKITGPHPDVKAGGVTYGAFEASVPFGELVTLTCMYEKKNYRVVRCANDEVTQTFNSYDDPQNVIEAPKNAIDAPKVEPPKEVK